ncbi:unnamed protein product [Closterium sp. Naga37s-1]|nr:unnamed protein product [Closterium sp. Naga37s-1]
MLFECTALTHPPPAFSNLSSLKTRTIHDAPSLRGALPGGFSHLASLKELTLFDLPHLPALPASYPAIGRSLTSLKLVVCSQITALPEEIGWLEALETLSLCDLPNLKSLPRSLCQLQRVKDLRVNDCGALQSLFGDEELGDAHTGAAGHDLAGRISLLQLASYTGSSSAAGSYGGSEESDTTPQPARIVFAAASTGDVTPDGLHAAGPVTLGPPADGEAAGKRRRVVINGTTNLDEREEEEEGEVRMGGAKVGRMKERKEKGVNGIMERRVKGMGGRGLENGGGGGSLHCSPFPQFSLLAVFHSSLSRDDTSAANFTGSAAGAPGGADLASLDATLSDTLYELACGMCHVACVVALVLVCGRHPLAPPSIQLVCAATTCGHSHSHQFLSQYQLAATCRSQARCAFRGGKIDGGDVWCSEPGQGRMCSGCLEEEDEEEVRMGEGDEWSEEKEGEWRDGKGHSRFTKWRKERSKIEGSEG